MNAAGANAALCIHGRTECSQCGAFRSFLIEAVEKRNDQWRPGVLGELNRKSQSTPETNQ